MTEPPEADILLLRRKGSTWTPEQLARLLDGIRESLADQILLELRRFPEMNIPRIAA